MPDTLCSDQFEDWEEEYDEWKTCNEAAGEVEEDYWKAAAATELACPGAFALVETVVGGIVAGVACAAGLWNMYDAWDDLKDKYEECAKQTEKTIKAGDKYLKCISDHKNDGKLK